MTRLGVLAFALVLVGCPSVIGADFEHPVGTGPDADGGATEPGPGPSNGADAAAPGADGNTVCAWADCKVPQPSNGATFGALPASGSVLVLASSTSFDTTHDCKAASALGDCEPVIQSTGPAACVCRFGSLTVNDLRVTGARGLVLFAHDTVAIAGRIDVAATGEIGGPGAEPVPADMNDAGLFNHGTENLVPLRGGVPGAPGNNVPGLVGGAGGGALQVSAGKSIVIEPKGTVQAGGGGGSGSVNSPANNGGSGGAILLEAPVIKLEGQLLANGGGGGGGGDGTNAGGHGQDARQAGRLAAAGGAGRDGNGCALSGYTIGGRGGNGAIAEQPLQAGQGGDFRACLPDRFVRAGGAGGGVGRIRINATNAESVQSSTSSLVSPTPSIGIMPIQ